ncbi:MAG: hypothetical protein Salg2KO_06070 [Salibacteraceae bacterium]
MEQVSNTITISREESAVLDVLIFFDAYNYPLKPSEIHQYVSIEMSPINVVPCLNYLENNEVVFQHDGFFSLSNDSSVVDERKGYNDLASKKIRSAQRYAALLERFPFVRSVGIAGNLSRGFFTPKDRIELITITKPGRKWIAQTLMNGGIRLVRSMSKDAFKIIRVYEMNSMRAVQEDLCNAIEVQSAIPTYNLEVYASFLETNNWSKRMLPMHKSALTHAASRSTHYPFKKSLEFMLGGKFGDMLEAFCARLHSSRTTNQSDKELADEAVRLDKAYTKRRQALHEQFNLQQATTP